MALAYRGSLAAGWQRQSGLHSLQSILEDALATIEGNPVTVRAAGRTDRGVHARMQIATAELRSDLQPRNWVQALRGILPDGFSVWWAAWAPGRFRPRNDCGRKTYVYRFRFSGIPDPFSADWMWQVYEPVDPTNLPALAASWLGQHDFAAASSTRRDRGSTIRTLDVSEFRLTAPDQACYRVASRGFLMHQVRILAGTLMWVGRGHGSREGVAAALAAGDRSGLGPTAPPHGLMLDEVELPDLAWEAAWPTARPERPTLPRFETSDGGPTV